MTVPRNLFGLSYSPMLAPLQGASQPRRGNRVVNRWEVKGYQAVITQVPVGMGMNWIDEFTICFGLFFEFGFRWSEVSRNSGGMRMVIGCPTASASVYPKMRCAPAFQPTITASRFLEMIASCR